MRSGTKVWLSATLSLMVLAGCASDDVAPGDQSEPPSRAMSEPTYPAFVESAEHLDDALVQQIAQYPPAVPEVDDAGDIARFQRWVADQYVSARLAGHSPVEAEVQFAALYDDTTLAKRAVQWTHDASSSWDADFLGAHQVPEDTSIQLVNGSERIVTVEWDMDDEQLCSDGHHHGPEVSQSVEGSTAVRPEHWGVLLIDVELIDGQPVITDFSHDGGCGCVSCAAGME